MGCGSGTMYIKQSSSNNRQPSKIPRLLGDITIQETSLKSRSIIRVHSKCYIASQGGRRGIFGVNHRCTIRLGLICELTRFE